MPAVEEQKDYVGSPEERLLKPSEFIREIKEQLAKQPKAAEAARESWLNGDSVLHIKLKGEIYDITYGKRKEQVRDQYVGKLGEDGHWTYRPANVEEVLSIRSGTRQLIVRAACDQEMYRVNGTISYSDSGVPDGSVPHLYEKGNVRAEFFAREMQQRMFGSPASIPGE